MVDVFIGTFAAGITPQEEEGTVPIALIRAID